MRYTPMRSTSALGLGLLVALTATSEAAPTSKANQQASHQQLVQALHELHAVHKVLEEADHDYGGHRADAVRDVHAAAEQLKEALEHHPHHKQAANAAAAHKHVAHKNVQTEPQKQSDQQLASAIPVLKQAVTTLKQSEHDFGGHREKAVEDIEKAIHQIEVALKYSKEHNQGKP
jgi:hypothetical protein